MIIMDHDRLCEYTTAEEFVVISGEFRIIGERAFAHGRMPVRFVVIPPGVNEIEDLAFYDCNKMLSIVIPGSVKKIGKAFTSSEKMAAKPSATRRRTVFLLFRSANTRRPLMTLR